MPPKGLPGVFAEKYWPACGVTPSTRKTTRITNLVRARRQVERHCYISNITCGAFHNGDIILSRFTEQGQVRGVRLEGDDACAASTAGAAPHCV